MYVQNQDMYVQNQDMYVQNQDMYVQNQDMYVQNQDISPFFLDNWNDLRYISNEQHQIKKIS